MSGMTTNARRPNGGFTLVEVVVSMGILAMVLLGICSAMLTTSAVNLQVERNVLVNNAVQKKIEEIKGVAARRGADSDNRVDVVYNYYRPNISGEYRRFNVPIPGVDNVLEGELFEYYGYVIPHTNETWLPGGENGRNLTFAGQGVPSKVRLDASGHVQSVAQDNEWYDLNGNGKRDTGELGAHAMQSIPVEVQVYSRAVDSGQVTLEASRVVLIAN